MFKNDLNRCRITFHISPETSFLIKSGFTTDDPSRPDMEFVRTCHSLLGTTVYIPGSSIKGVFRSNAEKVFRTLAAGLNVCETSSNKGCSDHKITGSAYIQNCPICQTFGSSTLASRVKFNDALPYNVNEEENFKCANLTETRANVSIDRIRGSVANGPFFIETVTAGKFYGEIIVKNFTLWQLGLLMYVIQEINDGYISMGYAKSRGLGKVKFNIENITFTLNGLSNIKNGNSYDLLGVQQITKLKNDYDKYFKKTGKYSDLLEISSEHGKFNDRLLYKEVFFDKEEVLKKLSDEFIKKLNEYLEGERQ